MRNEIDVSIVIVYFEGYENLKSLLSSIIKTTGKLKVETIIVDNSKSENLEKSLQKRRNIVNIKSPGNIGYGAGNNLGIRNSSGKYIFIANPDIQFLPNTLNTLFEFLEKRKDTAIVAPNLLDRNGKIFAQQGSRTLTPLRGLVALSFLDKLFPNSSISKRYWLHDLPLNKLREADAVPGSAFLIRREMFDRVGGFDENMFLYFEESDLGKRIKDKGYKIFINPKAEVKHFWDKGARKSSELNKHFQKSRFYYFKKHYGLISAILVEIFTRFSKSSALLFFILLLAGFLRFYQLPANLVFDGELGHNYLAVKNFIAEGRIPLLGPPTSHPWLYFPPLFYWIIAPVLVVGNYNPLSPAYFMAGIGTMVIILNYLVVKRLFDEKTALISSLLTSISPAFIIITRGSRFFSLVIPLFYPFVFAFYRSLLKGQGLFWVGLVLGIMLNFHFTPLVLFLPLGIFIYLNKKSFRYEEYLKGFTGLFIPLSPWVLNSISGNYKMLINFLIWVPYRLAGFIGLYPKNTANYEILKANVNSFYNFFHASFAVGDNIFITIALSFLVIYLFYKSKLLIKHNSKTSPLLLIIAILILGYVGLFIHGAPPTHYYLPLYPIPVILISVFLSELMAKRKTLVFAFLALVAVVNFFYLFSDKWYYQSRHDMLGNNVPYALQKRVSREIVTAAGGKPFVLMRVGSLDQYEGDFAQNYIYLMWLYGNEPKASAETVFTIYEGEENLPKTVNPIINLGGVFVGKN